MSVLGPGGISRLRYLRHGWHASRWKLFLLIGLFIAVALTYLVMPKLLHQNRLTYVGLRDKNEITILRWTPELGEYSNAKFITSKKCPHLQSSMKAGCFSDKVFDIPCRITYDQGNLKASDALVFNSWDLTRVETPKNRSKDQLWIYLQNECPGNTRVNLRDYPSVFNWTMTYRRDSDIYHPYGLVVPGGNEETASVTDLIITSNLTKKTSLNLGKRPNLVAWIVSYCDSLSRREDLVKELQNHISVSVYGRCGQAQACPPMTKDCYTHVAETHKFYLSFENTLCTDYITEKFFNALRNNLVPVVYGGTSLEDYSAIAPPGSYIDARNFTSAKDLAEYLVYLDKNEEEYMKYFEWKSKFKVIYSRGWCDLCQRVFEHLQLAPEEFSSSVPLEQKRSYKWYNDIWTWWNYISYDPSPTTAPLSVIGPSDNYQLGAPACQAPIEKLTGSETGLSDSEPGHFSRKLISKRNKSATEGLFDY